VLYGSAWVGAVHKMLVKLIPGVNFINVERTNFSYKYDVLAAFLVTFWLWQKIRTKNAREKTLMKLTVDLSKSNKWYLTEILFFSVVLFLL
jgi:hypothetical protein